MSAVLKREQSDETIGTSVVAEEICSLAKATMRKRSIV